MDLTSDTFVYIMTGGATFLLFFAYINAVVMKVLNKMADPERHFVVHPDGHEGMAADPIYAEVASWAAANGFEPEIVADFYAAPMGNLPTRIMVWKNAYRKTFLAAYYVERQCHQEFITVLTGDGMLTTSNTRNSATLPPAPGFYLQALDGLDITTLLRRHEEALVRLYENHAIAPVESPLDTDVLIMETLRRQAAYIQSLLLWQLRGVYWNFVRKYWYSNKTVA